MPHTSLPRTGGKEVPCTVEYPPDTTAASLWLRNRQPRLWRDKHEIDVADAGESLMDDMTGISWSSC